MADGDPLDWGPTRSPYEGYDTAQICQNGHTITSALTQIPQAAKPFCPECGAPTIKACPKCDRPIRGSSTDVLLLRYTPPKYCEACGAPFPWTIAALEAAKEMACVLDGLSEAEKADFSKSVGDLSSDTPKTPVAAAKVKRILAKLGGNAYQIAIKVVTDVATEAAKKQLGL